MRIDLLVHTHELSSMVRFGLTGDDGLYLLSVGGLTCGAAKHEMNGCCGNAKPADPRMDGVGADVIHILQLL